MTIGYITLGATDLEKALPFYDAVLGVFGYARGPVDGRWAFYGKTDAVGIGLCNPYDGQPASGGNGQMVSFKADSQEQIKQAYDIALAHGATDEGAPGFRPEDATSGFYGAYFRDAAGNKLCAYMFI